MEEVLKIVSGGQTGVDRAALDVALQLGMSCGGYCPKGRKSENGMIPEKYPLTEARTDSYPERTELNVRHSDGTLTLTIGEADRGTNLTIDLCRRYSKPLFVIDLLAEQPVTDVQHWIKQNRIGVLNVAGNRESISPGIHEKAYEFLTAVFKT
jgi:predicted Rossmann fold nucleotide-binding protein DprA/Smf involved in DNA uptake